MIGQIMFYIIVKTMVLPTSLYQDIVKSGCRPLNGMMVVYSDRSILTIRNRGPVFRNCRMNTYFMMTMVYLDTVSCLVFEIT
jgi:hypothetical protein